MNSPLAGRGVAITRPRDQALRLAALVEASGGLPVLFPAVEILEPLDAAMLDVALEQLEAFDLAVFASPTAVQKGVARARRDGRAWPAALRVAAIGRGSRRELERLGFRDVVAPETHADSEALLAMAQLQSVTGCRVAIFRGAGGRELLGETLASRGAEVTYLECYRRACPDADPGPLLAAWASGALQAVTVSSTEGVTNLFAMLGDAAAKRFRSTPLFAPHERVAAAARGLGAGNVVLAGPTDEEMHAALVAYFSAAQ